MNIQTIIKLIAEICKYSIMHPYLYGTYMQLIYCISIYIYATTCNLLIWKNLKLYVNNLKTYKATHIVTKPCETTFIHLYFIIKYICNLMWQYGMICTRMHHLQLFTSLEANQGAQICARPKIFVFYFCLWSSGNANGKGWWNWFYPKRSFWQLRSSGAVTSAHCPKST